MARILTFRPDVRRHDESPVARERRSAEVIVFPGVRYERWSDAPEPAGGAAKKRRRERRDVLELAE